ncbi:serine hydrolase domain-containing protein [Rhizohabitans arisaemae]|uniref:serine hydrolase domain-containing protein n=1 Tax=Rhizohabitans arisaemae TaxID=2720610 RepID=UPI0024B1E63C|nr:serine hydrolase domain-containing protein [Rhizohabitans arisaemae]
MSQADLSDFVRVRAEELGMPGVAVGVATDGRKTFTSHGVTSVENPLAVDHNTLFHFGSITKTFTATALMCLVASCDVDLGAPVRRYLPEFRVKDERVADTVTVLQLVNHTSGWDGLIVDTGEGDDALAGYVARMAGLGQLFPVGSSASYNNAAFTLAGRVIEKVTGKTYEKAVGSLLLGPLGLTRTFFSANEAITRRAAVGHHGNPDGSVSVTRPWRGTRNGNPMGGVTSTVADQLTWALFHLADGCDSAGKRILPRELAALMRQPSAELFGSALGDAVGIGWFLRDVDGVRTVGHGGSMNSQFAQLLMVPERDFAVVAAANGAPDGNRFTKDVVRWVLDAELGLAARDPEPLAFDEGRASAVEGTYESSAAWVTVTSSGRELTLEFGVKPEANVALSEVVFDYPPFTLGLLPGRGDRYILMSGAFTGTRGCFRRDETGAVVGVDFIGRLYRRVGSLSVGRGRVVE